MVFQKQDVILDESNKSFVGGSLHTLSTKGRKRRRGGQSPIEMKDQAENYSKASSMCSRHSLDVYAKLRAILICLDFHSI